MLRAMGIEYKLLNAAFKSLGGMQSQLEQEAAQGWSVQAAGPFYVFLARDGGPEREQQVARVLFHDTDWAIRLAQERAAEGWTLAALGPSFAFFSRPKGSTVPTTLRWHGRPIGLMTPGGIRTLLTSEGRDGWTVRAMTTSAALFEKPSSGANPVEHTLDGTLLRTAGMTERLLEERAAAGWRLACAGRLFLAFSREVPE